MESNSQRSRHLFIQGRGVDSAETHNGCTMGGGGGGGGGGGVQARRCNQTLLSRYPQVIA